MVVRLAPWETEVVGLAWWWGSDGSRAVLVVHDPPVKFDPLQGQRIPVSF